MKFDLDNALKGNLPWDFTLTVNGRDHETRRPNVAELGQLANLKQMKDADGFTLLAGFFVDPKPDLGTWEIEQVLGALAAYQAYFQQRAEKNSLTTAAAVRAAVVKSLESGT